MKQLTKFLTLLLLLTLGVGQMWARSFDGSTYIYFNAGAVGWWCNGNAVHIAILDASEDDNDNNNGTKVVGELVSEKVYRFLIPSGNYFTVKFTRNENAGSSVGWNHAGRGDLDDTKNYISNFSENCTSFTWETYVPPTPTFVSGETITYDFKAVSGGVNYIGASGGLDYDASGGGKKIDVTFSQNIFLTPGTTTFIKTSTGGWKDVEFRSRPNNSYTIVKVAADGTSFTWVYPAPPAPSVVEDGSLTWTATSSSPIVLGNGTAGSPFVVPLEAKLHLVAGGIRVVNPDANFTLQNTFDIEVDRLWDQNRTLNIWCVKNSDPSVHGTGLSPVVYYKATENCWLNLYSISNETQMAGGYVSETNHNTYTLTKVLEAGTYKFNFRDPALKATLYNWNSVADAKRFGNVTLTKTAEFDDFQFTLSKKMSVTFTFDIDRMTVSDKSITVNATPYLEDPAELHVQSNAFGDWTIESEAMAVNEGIYTYTLHNVPARQNPAEFNFWNKVDGNYSEWAHFSDAVSVTGATNLNNNFQVTNTELCDIVITATYANHTLSSVVVVQQPLTTNWKLNIWVDSEQNWQQYDFIRTSGGATTATYTLTLNSGEHDFELIKDGSSYYKNKGKMVRTNCSDWEFTTSEDRGKIDCDITGEYIFTIDFSQSNPTVSVTYPTLPTYTVTIAKNEAGWGTTKVNGEEVTEVANVEHNTTIGASNEYLRIGSATTVVAAPAAAGDYFYAFSGWTGIPDGGKVTENVTVTANFTRVPRLAITFNANGGSGSMEQLILTAAGALTSNTFTTPAYNKYFAGWADTKAKADAGTVDYANGAQITPAEALKGDLTLYAVWLTYNPVASISGDYSNIVAGSNQDVTFTPNTTDCTWPTSMTYVWQMFASNGTELSTSDDYFDITPGAETAVLPAATVASLPEGTYTIKLSVYAGDQCETNQLGETKSCTLTVAAGVVDAYYIYLGQTLTLLEGVTATYDATDDVNNIPAYYYDELTQSTKQYTRDGALTTSGNQITANKLGQYQVTLSNSERDVTTIYVYRYYAKFPWGYCGNVEAEKNRAWKWEALTYQSTTNNFTITGLYSNKSDNHANIGWDYYYDWQGVYRYDGEGNPSVHPGYDEGSNAGEWQLSYDPVTKTMETTSDAKDHGGSKYADISVSGNPSCGSDWFKLGYSASTPVNGSIMPNVLAGGSYSAEKTDAPQSYYTLAYRAGTGYTDKGVVSHDQPADEVADGTVVTFNAAANNGYFCTGWFSDEACTSPITTDEGVVVNMNTLVVEVHGNISVYAKFSEYRMLYGSFGEENAWINIAMDKIKDGEFQTRLALEGNKTYNFKVRFGNKNAYYGAQNLTITRTSNESPDKVVTQNTSEDYNIHLTTDLAGTYVFTWKDNNSGNKTIAVTYPTANMLEVWDRGEEFHVSKNFNTSALKGETTVHIETAGMYKFKMQNYESHYIDWYGITDKGEANAIQHSVYNWIMNSKNQPGDNVYFNATVAGDYHFILEWVDDNVVISVVYPADAVDYDITGVLNGTHQIVMVGMPRDWNQDKYYLYDNAGNILYSASTNTEMTIGGVIYQVGAIPVKNEDLRGGSDPITFKHGHVAELNLADTISPNCIYLVRNTLTSEEEAAITEGTVVEKKKAEMNFTQNSLYRFIPSEEVVKHSVSTSLAKSVTTKGVSVALSGATQARNKSVRGETNETRYYVFDGTQYLPATITAGKLDLTNQTEFDSKRDYKMITCMYDGYMVEKVGETPFDIVDIAMTDDNNGTYCYTTYYNSKDKTVVPEGLKAFTIAYNSDENTLFRSHTFVAGDVIPAGTAVVFQGPASFMTSKQDNDNPRSAGNRILTRVTEGDGTKYQSALYGTDNSGSQVGQLTPAAQYFKFSRNINNDNGSLGWYWGVANGAGTFSATPHKAYLALPTSQAPLRIIMSEIAAGQQLPTMLEQNGVNGERALKQLRDGRVVILRAGRIYDLNGRLIEQK